MVDRRIFGSYAHSPRRYGVDIDPLGGPFIAQSFGQLGDTAFTHGIPDNPDAADERCQTGRVDDLAGHVVADPVAAHVAAQHERRGQVDLDQLLDRLERVLGRVVAVLDARDVEQDVDAAVLRRDSLDQRGDVVLVAQVARFRGAFAAECLDGLLGCIVRGRRSLLCGNEYESIEVSPNSREKEEVLRQCTMVHTQGLFLTCIKTTSAPASARAIAMACPIPLVAPVTMAVLPCKSNRDEPMPVSVLVMASSPSPRLCIVLVCTFSRCSDLQVAVSRRPV